MCEIKIEKKKHPTTTKKKHDKSTPRLSIQQIWWITIAEVNVLDTVHTGQVTNILMMKNEQQRAKIQSRITSATDPNCTSRDSYLPSDDEM